MLTASKIDVRQEIGAVPEVCVAESEFGADDLYVEKRKWISIDDALVVVADLKNSTKLGVNRRASSTARIYQASTGNVAKIFDSFEADYLGIQGDGVFAIFWGENRVSRALCAGVTIKTFSLDLVDQLESKWNSLPETGLKVGVASGKLLAKKIGVVHRPEWQEPVWPGRAVNYAFKAAAAADRHEMIVTRSVWDRISSNDFLRYSCGCGGRVVDLWRNMAIEKLPEGDKEASGMILASSWCSLHGEEYCQAILKGEKKRKDVELRKMKDAILNKSEQERYANRNKRKIH